MSSADDDRPRRHPYVWFKASDVPIEDFVEKYRPSRVRNNGTNPWIWVRGTSLKDSVNEDDANKEAAIFLQGVTERIKSIQNDTTIPLRSNKTTGTKGKKEIREQIQADAVKTLEEISTKHGYVSGKWLLFVPTRTVDMVWKGIATSFASGPLAATSMLGAKVSTLPEEWNEDVKHLICVYIPNVYDRQDAVNVMKILLENHGQELSGVKSNLYTTIGLYTKHPSGISPLIWKNTDLLRKSEIDRLKGCFGAESKLQLSTSAVLNESTEAGPLPMSNKRRTSRKPEKKQEDDPFVSDVDDDFAEEERRKELQELKATSALKSREGQ